VPGYAALPTKNPGDVLTSALWNTYLQGNADSGFMRMLADSTLSGAAASIDFTSIPSTFAHLMLVAYLRGDNAAALISALLRANNDSAANYLFEQVSGAAAAASATSGAAQTAMTASGLCAAAGAAAGTFTPIVAFIPHYTNVVGAKTMLGLSFYAGTPQVQLLGNYWSSTAAINRLTLLPSVGNFIAGSRFTLYGLPQ
jgi:hypothetical protein